MAFNIFSKFTKSSITSFLVLITAIFSLPLFGRSETEVSKSNVFHTATLCLCDLEQIVEFIGDLASSSVNWE
jgi:hypothetical protein